MRHSLPALLLGFLTVLTVHAAAQDGPTLPPGSIYLTEGLEVAAGETLTIGPGTSLTGPGNITVWGTLVVNGTEGSPAEFSVQIRILGDGRADLRQARLWGVNATALEVYGGKVTMERVLLEGNTRAAIVKGSSTLEAREVVFRDHAGEALYVEDRAQVRLTNTTFSGNGRGVTLYSAHSFHANDSDFVANGQHVVVDLGPWSAPGADLLFARNTFHAPASTPAQLPSIALRHDPPLVDAGEERFVTFDSNRIEGAPVGMRIEGRGLVVDSTNDTFVGNRIGLSVQQSTVRLHHATLGNDRDIEGSGRVTLDDATYLSGQSPSVTPTEAVSWLPWALGGLAALFVAGVVFARMRPPPAPPAASFAPPPAPEPAAAPVAVPVARTVDVSAPLTQVERRILLDILEHPGTPQRAVAERLGYTRQALHYHVKKLETRGFVRKSVEGRETRCKVPDEVAPLVLANRTGSQEKA